MAPRHLTASGGRFVGHSAGTIVVSTGELCRSKAFEHQRDGTCSASSHAKQAPARFDLAMMRRFPAVSAATCRPCPGSGGRRTALRVNAGGSRPRWSPCRWSPPSRSASSLRSRGASPRPWLRRHPIRPAVPRLPTRSPSQRCRRTDTGGGPAIRHETGRAGSASRSPGTRSWPPRSPRSSPLPRASGASSRRSHASPAGR